MGMQGKWWYCRLAHEDGGQSHSCLESAEQRVCVRSVRRPWGGGGGFVRQKTFRRGAEDQLEFH